MTQPAPDSRHTVDSITSDQLDQLYAELDRLRARVQDWRTSTAAGIRLVDDLRAERDALAAGVPLICSDERHTTRTFALETEIERLRTAEERAERAEAALNAVRAELTALNSETAGLNPYAMAGRRDAVARVRAALDAHTNPKDQPT